MDDMTYQPAPEPTPTSTKRMMADIDTGNRTVTYAGRSFALSDLPEKAVTWLALRGLSLRLQSVEDPEAAFLELKGGKTPADRRQIAEKVDPWAQAIAAQIADERAEAEGMKRFKPGGRVPTEEFAGVLAEAEKAAANLSAEGRRALRRLPGVVAHHARITGAAGSALAVLGAA